MERALQIQEVRLGSSLLRNFWKPPTPSFFSCPLPLAPTQKGSYQDVQAGSLEQGDLVGDGQAGEARQTLGELHNLNNALGGQLTEFVPEAQVQSDPVVSTGILRGGEKRGGRRRVNDDMPPGGRRGVGCFVRMAHTCFL